MNLDETPTPEPGTVFSSCSNRLGQNAANPIVCDSLFDQEPGESHRNKIQFYCVKSGRLSYLLGSKKIEVKAGALSIFWALTSLRITGMQPGTEYHVVSVPLSEFLSWDIPDNVRDGVLNGELITTEAHSGHNSDFTRFHFWSTDLKRSKGAMSKSVVLEMQARLIRMSGQRLKSLTAGSPQTAKTNLSKADRMAHYVAISYSKDITVQSVSAAVGLHPNYAMSLFKRTFGTTLIKYITQLRVSHAQWLLVTTQKSITEIAFLSGFNSTSRFNSAFQEALNCPPRSYRVRERAPKSLQ